MIIGKQTIAGQWVGSERTFRSSPANGIGREYALADKAQVDQAVDAAEDAFYFYSELNRDKRIRFLLSIASELEARQEILLSVCGEETGLPHPRLQVEFNRTVNQLRFFAEHVDKKGYLDFKHDVALPDRNPMPRPDLKVVQRPIGPVAVFGASNFPMAFSTLGGDTVAALAAGCPVVVKGHSAHPGTADISAQAINAAVIENDIHPGVFSQIQGEGFLAGVQLVKHPLIKAVGFTGSLIGGRALFDICAARPEPIPFYGELGSINPVFVLSNALRDRGGAIAKGWAESVSASAGQFCTNPGVIVLPEGDHAQIFIDEARDVLKAIPAQTMLSDGICDAYRAGHDKLRDSSDTTQILRSELSRRSASGSLYSTTGAAWLADRSLGDEVFGPLGIIVLAKNEAEVLSIAKSLHGQLVGTLQMDQKDEMQAKQLLPVLERKAGRIVINGFPTGVEVCDAMVHGGPYPASTNFGATSVGSLSIRRFLRPVCYQSLPTNLWDRLENL